MKFNNLAFDNEELFHLSLKAMENNQSEQAILHLKQLLDKDPEHGRAHYLLGAMHAEIGMFPRAIENMRRAVDLEPDLYIAHFQLGLLYATDGLTTEAEQAWSALDGLGNDNPLFVFKRGLIHLIHDDFEACKKDLRSGIQLNKTNPALNNDMSRILGTVSQLAKPEVIAPSDTDTPVKGGQHILLSAYQNVDYDDRDIEH